MRCVVEVALFRPEGQPQLAHPARPCPDELELVDRKLADRTWNTALDLERRARRNEP
jgi:hypothetical protein